MGEQGQEHCAATATAASLTTSAQEPAKEEANQGCGPALQAAKPMPATAAETAIVPREPAALQTTSTAAATALEEPAVHAGEPKLHAGEQGQLTATNAEQPVACMDLHYMICCCKVLDTLTK